MPTQPAATVDRTKSDLLKRIVPLVFENGLKATTMDLVASRLGISKRTLYELFNSKSEMIEEVLAEIDRQSQETVMQIYEESDNVMEALVKVFMHNRDQISNVNVEFYRDMDRLYRDKRESYNKIREQRIEKMIQMFRLGVEQGMFRDDVDYVVQCRVMALQMEALKRFEELFPSDIPVQRIFDGIIVGFLRSVASEKGMKIVDNVTKSIS